MGTSISTGNGALINTAETVLVVDDEEVVRGTAQAALQRAGYSVVTAVNGQGAVDLFRARHREIRLIILDLTMPVMGGAETLLHLRKIDPDVLVIGSSGYDETKAAARFGMGVVAFLQKPYRADVLTHKVAEVLQRVAQRSEGSRQ